MSMQTVIKVITRNNMGGDFIFDDGDQNVKIAIDETTLVRKNGKLSAKIADQPSNIVMFGFDKSISSVSTPNENRIIESIEIKEELKITDGYYYTPNSAAEIYRILDRFVIRLDTVKQNSWLFNDPNLTSDVLEGHYLEGKGGEFGIYTIAESILNERDIGYIEPCFNRPACCSAYGYTDLSEFSNTPYSNPYNVIKFGLTENGNIQLTPLRIQEENMSDYWKYNQNNDRVFEGFLIVSNLVKAKLY